MALVVLFVSLVCVFLLSPVFDVYLWRAGYMNIRRKEFLSVYGYEVPDEMSSQGSLAHLFRAYARVSDTSQEYDW